MEVPFTGPADDLWALARHTEEHGLRPVIAHPERTEAVQDEPGLARAARRARLAPAGERDLALGSHGPDAEALGWELVEEGGVRSSPPTGTGRPGRRTSTRRTRSRSERLGDARAAPVRRQRARARHALARRRPGVAAWASASCSPEDLSCDDARRTSRTSPHGTSRSSPTSPASGTPARTSSCSSRARAGKRHDEELQEETYVPVRGTLTVYVGEPAERHEIPVGGIVHVQPGTARQIANEHDGELLVYIYGAPAG